MSQDAAEQMLDDAVMSLANLLIEVATSSLMAIDFMSDIDTERPVMPGSVRLSAEDQPYDRSPTTFFEAFDQARSALDDAEALTATILNRCGVSWAAMTTGSRQAIHKRLATRGEALLDYTAWAFGLESRLRFIRRWTEDNPDGDALAGNCMRTVDALMRLRRVPLWWRGKFFFRRWGQRGSA